MTTTSAEPTRRDFLFIATGAVGAVGAAATLVPLISQMNPDASTIAASDFAVTNASVAGISGSGTSYTATFTPKAPANPWPIPPPRPP